MPVDWYENDVRLVVQNATRDSIEAIAFQVEALAKVNITRNGQVDTGFMRASVYVTTDGGVSSYGENSGDASARNRDATMAPEMKPPNDGAVIAVGASYAIFQETKNSFLFRALEETAGQVAESEIQEVSRNYD